LKYKEIEIITLIIDKTDKTLKYSLIKLKEEEYEDFEIKKKNLHLFKF